MKKAAEYRQHADECRALARQMADPEQRNQLLTMADTWEQLAREREAAYSVRMPEEKLSVEADESSVPIGEP